MIEKTKLNSMKENRENDKEIKELQSKMISFLRFPLIVGVVILHSYLESVSAGGVSLLDPSDFPFCMNLSYFLTKTFTAFVPAFFLISGYLYFLNFKEFTKQGYFIKVKKRIKTLLVPYLFWNSLILLLLIVQQSVVPGLGAGGATLIKNYTLVDWIKAYWLPVSGQLWFVRDLFIVSILSPLVYYALKKCRIYALLFLGIIWYSGLIMQNIQNFTIMSLFFFTLGAYCSLFDKNIIGITKPYFKLSVFLFVVISVIIMLNRGNDILSNYLLRINILVELIILFNVTAYLVSERKWSMSNFLSKSSFFIYIFHYQFTFLFLRLACKFLSPQSELMLFLIYIACPVFVIGLGLVIYYCLEKYFPKVLVVVAGGR